jgi:formylglycine-generating enzyme required for sulfatase activity
MLINNLTHQILILKQLLIVLILTAYSTLYSQIDTVTIRVDVLGQSYSKTNYYHPIEGDYLIKNNKTYNLTKKQNKAFNGLEYINPTSKLTTNRNHVQANSLRHYIDPSELVYINWGVGSDTTNETKLDEFIKNSKSVRKSNYQSIVQNYFNSFYIKNTEVTNLEYRQFVNWVKDSIQMEAIYMEYPSFEKAKLLLNIPKNIIINDTTNRKKLRQNYNLNFNCDYLNLKSFDQELLYLITKPFRVNSEERWYKRKEVDITCLYYNYKNTLIHIYPDTLTWSDQHPVLFNDPMVNMYFWHPAYDYHPVVGISKKQAEAYCYWETQQFKNKINELNLPFDIEIELPNTKDYENTIRYNINELYESEIEDYTLITNLKLEQSYSEKHVLSRVKAESMNYADKTLKSSIPTKRPNSKRLHKKIFKNQWWYNDYNETHQKLIEQKVFENYIENDICFLSNNVSEWMTETYKDNYANLIKAYINFNCFASATYCETQKLVDETLLRANDKDGHLIYGGNWFDERYGSNFGVNISGLYPKKFKQNNKQFATVGFRYVVRLSEK